MSISVVYHGGALGDFLTCLPAMAAWRRRHPGENLILLGKPAFAELAPRGLFDEVWDAESPRLAWLFGAGADSRTAVSVPLSSVSSALLFSSAGSALSANLTRAGVRSVVRQDPFPTAPMSIVDYHLSLFSGVPFTEEERTPLVARGDPALSVSPETAALHPGSGSARKNWPLTRFVSLSRLLQARGFHVAWIAGPAEESVSFPPGAVVWRDVPLPHLAAALASCSLYVGNDSGITHLAAAAGCPTVALFGPTDPAVWAPRGRSVRVVTAPEQRLSMLSEETVLEDCFVLLRK